MKKTRIPKILFRVSLAEENEFKVAFDCGFDCLTSRAMIKKGDFVIPRYSALPYYEELETDCNVLGGKLANTYRQHRYVADLANWYPDLKDYTPHTWFSLESMLADETYWGPYVLKGATNSRKNLWKTHMYAANKAEARQVYFNLQEDSLVGQQDIYIRRFEEFVTFDYNGITGQPITKEFRFFVWNSEILCGGYYWSSFLDVVKDMNLDTYEAMPFVEEVVAKIGSRIPFFVVDVAQRADGQWRVVELNDGQMSGLSCIDPHTFYSSLWKVFEWPT